MKFRSFPKFALLLTLVGVLALTLGCGTTIGNLKLTQGNWAVTATSTAAAKVTTGVAVSTFVLGGNITQSGTTLTGTLNIDNSVCITPQKIAFTGTVKDNKITLTSARFDGIVITVEASGTKDSLTGTYTVTGGCPDQGTITANAVPSVSGTWSGPILVDGIAATMSVALTEAPAASADGSFALTGTVTYPGLACTSTLTASSIKGGRLNLSGDTGFSYVSSLNSNSAPTTMFGDYDSSVDACATSPDPQTPTLTKQ